MKVVWKYGAIFALILLLIPLASVGAQGGDGDPERGGELYVEFCAVCHGVNGQGRVGASLQNFPGIDVGAALEQTISDGIPGSVMPAWAESNGGPLTDQQIDDIIAYIQASFAGTEPVEPLPTYQPPDIPPLPNVQGDPSQGAVVYEENCVMCHGENGRGYFGAPLAKNWASNQPAVFIRDVVRTGISGTAMPAWAMENGGPLTEDQIDDVSAFVLALSPSVLEQSTPTAAPGPLNLSTSLVLLAALAAVVIVVVVLYYRRA